jgi:hypothetical protein
VPPTSLSRRRFLELTTLATGGILSAPGFLRAQNAGTKLNVAIIGVGGQGRGRTNEAISAGAHIAAICELDPAAVARAKKEIAEKHPTVDVTAIKIYADYRELLADKSIDAVVIATPDHWHAPMAKAALKAGKHVFCEKPLTHTVAEARELRELARSSKLVTQMGNQGSANRNLRRGIEVIQAGVLGKIEAVRCWGGGGGVRPGLKPPTLAEADPVPEGFNWDAWCGPAAARPYKNGYYHPFNWRGWNDFGSGALGDFGCHNMNLPLRALKLDYPIALDIDAQMLGLPTYPAKAKVDYRFGSRGSLPPVTLTWYDGGRRPDRSFFPKELLAYFDENQGPAVDKQGKPIKRDPLANGTLILAENGYTFGSAWNGTDYIFLQENPKLWGILNHPACKNIPQVLPKSPGHINEWINASLGGAPVFSDFEIGGHLTEVVLSGVVALRTGKNLDWDGQAMKARNAPEADLFVRTRYRETWL